MTEEEHKKRHQELHRYVDELVADYICHHINSLPSTTTVMELIHWSHQQTINPDKEKE